MTHGSAPMLGEKHRLRFEKSGHLRLLSHLDLLRSVERLCRRVEIRFKTTQGFHPAPRIVIAMALPLGVVGRHEVMEIELQSPLESSALSERLNTTSPNGLRFLSAYSVATNVTAAVRRAIYKLEISENDFAIASDAVPTLLSEEKVWAARQKPKPRQINIRPYIRDIIVEPRHLTFDFWVTPTGTARADELIALLGLPSPYVNGAALERSDLELHDEVYDGLPDAPPAGTPELKPLNTPQGALPCKIEPATLATWGMSPNGPVVE